MEFGVILSSGTSFSRRMESRVTRSSERSRCHASGKDQFLGIGGLAPRIFAWPSAGPPAGSPMGRPLFLPPHLFPPAWPRPWNRALRGPRAVEPEVPCRLWLSKNLLWRAGGESALGGAREGSKGSEGKDCGGILRLLRSLRESQPNLAFWRSGLRGDGSAIFGGRSRRIRRVRRKGQRWRPSLPLDRSRESVKAGFLALRAEWGWVRDS